MRNFSLKSEKKQKSIVENDSCLKSRQKSRGKTKKISAVIFDDVVS